MFRGPGRGQQLDGDPAEQGLTALVEAAERAVEKIGSTVPPAPLRALLILDRAGNLNLNRLAALVGASASATSRLCDRMEVAGLLTRDRAVGRPREIVLALTQAGRGLAARGSDHRGAPPGRGQSPGDRAAAHRVRPAAGRLGPRSAARRFRRGVAGNDSGGPERPDP